MARPAWVNRPTSKCRWGDRRPGRTASSLLLRSAERNVLHTLLLALVIISGLRIRTAVSYALISTIAAWKRGIAERSAKGHCRHGLWERSKNREKANWLKNTPRHLYSLYLRSVLTCRDSSFRYSYTPSAHPILTLYSLYA